ncbi:unnamed protein product [Arabidopsis thaliana]|uniref:Uncharacterized protein n=4 Tax=Arabidopsis TaxID=3701 RepID=A0A654F223_ARATH|nr:uncharacterized protein AT2G41082 [Arabidopsis thaliana]KAG7639286.1 hypothetical protein ISN45_At02g036190 [Arabidopsis thaliana x Arabidopsis arenosa]KAG7643874.1 hypothetical protein ISN44_As02g036330 [Arabidopsis suecica]AEC09926.1 hypothetical protein AT2G41082 [Arabidopsis thaliana]CAA0376076.1 unnamed protein product [Arabidopsis thaliana]VYS55140.1 unnamed protein product [Arabidopsis thaliana]|eukprot:NP_001118492.1 hypothetical protein AT2G41082 [Arabidopsis thaliana]
MFLVVCVVSNLPHPWLAILSKAEMLDQRMEWVLK